MQQEVDGLIYHWGRFSKGYEVSTRGDKRFSAFIAKTPDGRSIEEVYQGDVKGYDPGGTRWRLGKGKPPLDLSVDLWKEYLALWREWATRNENLMLELKAMVSACNYTLVDRYASSPVNQARALATLLSERVYKAIIKQVR